MATSVNIGPLIDVVDRLIDIVLSSGPVITRDDMAVIGRYEEWRRTLATIERHDESISVPTVPPDVTPNTVTEG